MITLPWPTDLLRIGDLTCKSLAERKEMDMLNERAVNTRFLYFVDAVDARGKVIYVRLDGDYGFVEPAP
ncbi:MAG TPA: hypothetical protein VH247_07910 [Thermoleophilaceae bacterium]|jgi:hypothetical protein|nr:hypothetical protein [Thermoleophilaceae bacterium]